MTEEKKKVRPTVAMMKGLEGTIANLKSEIATLEQSNKLMENELKCVRRANKSLNELNDRQEKELRALKSRGFWARVFNM